MTAFVESAAIEPYLLVSRCAINSGTHPGQGAGAILWERRPRRESRRDAAPTGRSHSRISHNDWGLLRGLAFSGMRHTHDSGWLVFIELLYRGRKAIRIDL